MEIRQLRYFVSAATHMNFTKAAKECFIVQSSMAEQIANLENELGVKLFDRQRKGLALTEAGEFFLPKAKAILSEAENARAEMDSFRAGYQCLLRIGYHGELFKTDLIQILKTYRKEFPAVRVALRQLPQDELLEGLRDGQFDVALMPYKECFEAEKWMETDIVAEMGPMLVMAKDHPLAGRKSITVAELKSLFFISLEEAGKEDLRQRIEPETQNVALALDHTSNEILVAGGYGVSLWAERLCKPEQYPNLHFAAISDYQEKKRFVLAWRQGKLGLEGERFCEQFREQIEKGG